MTQYITRAYNSFTIDYTDSTIRKYSREDRLVQETEYYKNVPPHLAIHFPRLISSGYLGETKEYFLELELYPYENLGKLLIAGKLSDFQWTEIARHLTQILSEFNATTRDISFEDDLRAMYFDKTETEYKKLAMNFDAFKPICAQKELKLDGHAYENFEVVWPKIKQKFETKLIDQKLIPSVIHGDFCFSNILVGFLPDGKTILRFVDPRGKFGKLMVYGDPYYDLAKLMHSTDVGYEYFIYDQFQVTQKGEKDFILAYSNSNKQAVNKIFYEQLYSKYDVTRIKLIEATIYIGMCARHYDSEQRQLGMYLSGVRLFNEVLKE